MPIPASLAAREERKEAPSQKGQGSLEKAISTAMNDLLGPRLDTASFNSHPQAAGKTKQRRTETP